MNALQTRKYRLGHQLVLAFAMVLLVFCFSLWSVEWLGYRSIGFLFLLAVSVVAMLFDFLPVLMTAFLSALLWNFFFIPPAFTLHIDNAEDNTMFVTYFVIALVNMVLMLKIRKEEKRASDREEKEKTIQLYTVLLNSLSHELRTPIATIIAAVDTLKDDTLILPQSQRNELLQQIGSASLRLDRQVGNLLHASRIESGTLQLKKDWTDLNEMIFDVINKMPPEHHHHIVFDPQEELPYCRLDRGLMEQVLFNLIHNAINYTPLGSTIFLSTTMHDHHCQIVVRDDGPGIPNDALPHLFDAFYRLPQSPAGGVGLGLSIVKGFVEAHGGVVLAENVVPHGVQFTLRIPVETSYINHLDHA